MIVFWNTYQLHLAQIIDSFLIGDSLLAADKVFCNKAIIMHSIVVFCGSKKGSRPIYEEVAEKTGQILAANNIRTVYGGGSVGLMGILARSAMKADGHVLGVIPDFLLEIEGMDIELTENIIVKSMHERKVIMAQQSDAVLVLPGAYGTFDELFEMLTLTQLNQGSWPIGILNINGYYDHLLAQINFMHQEGFLNDFNKNLIQIDQNPHSIIQKLIAGIKDPNHPSKLITNKW